MEHWQYFKNLQACQQAWLATVHKSCGGPRVDEMEDTA